MSKMFIYVHEFNFLVCDLFIKGLNKNNLNTPQIVYTGHNDGVYLICIMNLCLCVNNF